MTTQQERLDVLAVSKRGDKSTWTRIGTAFRTKGGEGWKLKLGFFPIQPETEILLLPPRVQKGGVSDEEFADPLFPFDPERIAATRR